MESRYIPIEIRREILNISNKLCEYCKSPKDFSIDLFSFDHIIPISLGGKTVFINLAYSCGACNSYKNAKIDHFDLLDQEKVTLFHPRLQNWEDHFKWSEESLKIEGITSTGRATVELLRFNRLEVVNFRRMLLSVGEHPNIF